jgi:hypothetical protein
VTTVNWGAVVVGGVAGLAAGILLAIPPLALGLADADEFSGQALLILLGFFAQLVAGFVAGRFAGFGEARHGGFAALGLYAVTAGLSIASGQDPPIGTLVFSAVVAMVLGTAGGVLAKEVRDRREHRSDG